MITAIFPWSTAALGLTSCPKMRKICQDSSSKSFRRTLQKRRRFKDKSIWILFFSFLSVSSRLAGLFERIYSSVLCLFIWGRFSSFILLEGIAELSEEEIQNALLNPNFNKKAFLNKAKQDQITNNYNSNKGHTKPQSSQNKAVV